jgi:DNA-binding response OmpR family regulator
VQGRAVGKCARTLKENEVPTAKPNTSPADATGYGAPARKQVSQTELLKFRILSISTAPEDHHQLSKILKECRWQVSKAGTCKEAVSRLYRKRMPVVICSSDLPDGTWRDVLHQINALADPPFLIVTSRLADDYLWAEVLNLGGYNVLAKPFRESEVKHVVSSVWMREHGPVRQATAGGGA